MTVRLSTMLVLLTALPALAEQPVRINEVRIGLPAGRYAEQGSDNKSAFIAKANAWAPLYVDLEILKGVTADAALVIETTDTDDLATRTFVKLQSLAGQGPGTKFTAARATPYVRAGGNRYGEVKVTVCLAEDGVPPDRWSAISEPFNIRESNVRDSSKYVILSLGSDLDGFRLPKESGENDSNRSLRGGRIETAVIKDAALMPDRWFGYEAADLIVFCTSNPQFLNELLANPANRPRMQALMEWVRRGGRIIFSIGKNAGSVARPECDLIREMLPVEIDLAAASSQVSAVPMAWAYSATRNTVSFDSLEMKDRSPFTTAKFKVKGDRRNTLLNGDSGRITMMQGAYGLGRVTAVAFDLDDSPFKDYLKRAEYWNCLINEAGSAKAANWSLGNKSGDLEEELAARLRQHVDHFEGVPVVSFGWVAVFILLYTLLIGPVEYYILKKVFGRLELTWLTFPVIVISVSAIAYITAYAIKGKDLRINKVDVIDIDPAGGRIYGQSWITIFSPRIDTYRVGLDPNTGWAAESEQMPAGSLVDWFGAGRTGGRSFLRRNYWYKLDPTSESQPFDTGLVDVPIPVWSTKAFSVNWSAEVSKAKPPVVSNLIHPLSNAENVAGSFTLNLPVVEIQECYLVYAGIAYKMENPIRSGAPVNLFLDAKLADANWLTMLSQKSPLSQAAEVEDYRRGPAKVSTGGVGRSMIDLLFHDAKYDSNDSQHALNSGFRRLDQSWRLSPKNRDEVILVAKLPEAKGESEEVLKGSPTRLWLRELPGEGPRTAIPGSLKQDTYLRIYIPIAHRAEPKSP